MNTQSSPIITEMKVIPVAGHDSMLMNIGGAHNAWFTRNIVVLSDNAGNTGVGEAPGGEVIYQTLVEADSSGSRARGRSPESRGATGA
jgi:D-glucarate dehydratase (EC 4.2.1.40)